MKLGLIKKMGVERGEGCFMLKADPRGKKKTDGKGDSRSGAKLFAGGILKLKLHF